MGILEGTDLSFFLDTGIQVAHLDSARRGLSDPLGPGYCHSHEVFPRRSVGMATGHLVTVAPEEAALGGACPVSPVDIDFEVIWLKTRIREHHESQVDQILLLVNQQTIEERAM